MIIQRDLFHLLGAFVAFVALLQDPILIETITTKTNKLSFCIMINKLSYERG